MRSLTYLLLCCSCYLLAQEKDPITFDGIVTPEEWQTANKFEINYEIQPGNNIPSPYQTTAYVLYSPTHLYVGFNAEADPTQLRSAIRNRDEAFVDDFVTIGIDTYGDGRYMIVAGANPQGSQVDLKLEANGNDDDGYDLNFESKANKHEKGYDVELKIPFNTLQFSNAPQQKWKIIFYRNAFANGVRSQNIDFPVDRENACFICQAEKEIHIENIQPEKRVNIIPYVFGGRSGQLSDTLFEYDNPNFNVGVSGLFDLNNQTSLEFTLNPDFSQVEADVSQINANTTFALRFPERRPFFNEGRDIVTTELNTVYTRSINQPILSNKLIHQGANDRVYWLTALDNKTAYLIGGENDSFFGEGTRNFSNILRYQRTFNQGSHLGFLTTNRILTEGGYDHTFGFTALWRFSEKYSSFLEWNKSLTKEPIQDWIEETDRVANTTLNLDGERFNGNALSAGLTRNSERWNSGVYYNEFSPLYRAPLGFISQNAYRNLNFEQGFQTFFEDKFVRQMNWQMEGELTYNYWGVQKLATLSLGTFMEMASNLRTFIGVENVFREEFKGFTTNNLRSMRWFLGFNPSELMRLNFFVRYGESIGYRLDDLEVGNQLFLNFNTTLQFTDKLRLGGSLRYSQLAKKQAEGLHFKGFITRMNLNYQFDNALSFRLIGEYNEFSSKFFFQPLLKWNPNPFTIFYIGGNNNYEWMEESSEYVLENAQLYFKLQYQFEL